MPGLFLALITSELLKDKVNSYFSSVYYDCIR